jgi:hypothetical protein
MGWLDFFKSEIEEEPKKVSLSETDELLKSELNKEEKKVSSIKEKVNEKTGEFVSKLNEQIEILGLIDLKKSKQHERVKSITLHNLKEYSVELEKLITNLENVDHSKNIHSYFKEIKLVMDKFVKGSRKKLEKASTLIGKELGETEEIIRGYYKNVDGVAKKNNGTISRIKNIAKVGNMQESLLDMGKVENEMNKVVSNLKKEKKETKKEIIKKEEELSLFKESKEFKDEVKTKENINIDKDNLNKDIFSIKEKIDIKSLLNKFHSVEKDRELLKNYRSDFISTLENDSTLEILGMVSDEVGNELKRIKEKNISLKEDVSFKLHGEVNALEEVLRKNSSEINDIDNRIEEENKKLNKFNEKSEVVQKERIEMIKDVLNVEIV